MNHPFTGPREEDLDRLESDPGSVRARAYDVVVNGWELGSGSIRIHRADLQERVFRVLGISAEEGQERFGFLLDALKYGAPPHGGIALGLDRICAIAAGATSLRDVIAFPKTTSGIDLMTKAPADVLPGQLAELGLRAAGPAIGVSPTPAERPRVERSAGGRAERSGSARGFCVTPGPLSRVAVGPFPPRVAGLGALGRRIRSARRWAPPSSSTSRSRTAKPRSRWRTWRRIAEAALAAGLRRDDAFVAVGGGVVDGRDRVCRGDPSARRGVECRADDDGRHGRRRDRREDGRQSSLSGRTCSARSIPRARCSRTRPASRRCPTGTIAPGSWRHTRRPGSRTRSSPRAPRESLLGGARARGAALVDAAGGRCPRQGRNRRSRSAGRGTAASAQLRPHAGPRRRGRGAFGNAPARRGGRVGHRRGAGNLEAARRPARSEDAAAIRRCSPRSALSRSPSATRRGSRPCSRSTRRRRRAGTAGVLLEAIGRARVEARCRFRRMARRGRYNVFIVSRGSGRRRIRLFVLLSGALILASLVPLLVAEAVLIRPEPADPGDARREVPDALLRGDRGPHLRLLRRRRPAADQGRRRDSAGGAADGQGSLRLDRRSPRFWAECSRARTPWWPCGP